jgi:hypothetical protein
MKQTFDKRQGQSLTGNLTLKMGSSLLAALTTSVNADFPLPFFDEAINRGVVYLVQQGEFDGDGAFGCGVALADLNNDGAPELVCTGAANSRIGLFINNGHGMFTRMADSGLPDLPNASGVVAADYDGDGDLDLHFTCWNEQDRLYRNDGSLSFTDVTKEAGMENSAGSGTGAAWSDYDRDGDLDLYVANRSGSLGNWHPNQFWHNNGNGTFTDIAASRGLDDIYATMQPVWFDYDLDGDSDLYLSTDKGGNLGSSNRLFRTDPLGFFTEVSTKSHANVAIDSMGVGIGDLDGNGFLDIYCTNIPLGNPLLKNNEDGTFSEISEIAGVTSNATGWGAHFFDFDNDADEDLYVCNMNDGMNRLYWNHRTYPLEEVAPYCNVQCLGDSYCMAVGDVDLDGDLDIVVQNHKDLIRLFINNEGGLRNWVKFDVRGIQKNPYAVGSRLVAKVEERITTHEIAAGSNYKSSNDYIQHFGLDDQDQLQLLTVHFSPFGSRILCNVPGNQTWSLLHPNLLGDIDEDGDVDPLDLAGYAPAFEVTPFQKGWEVLDFDGNFLIDDEDVEAFLTIYNGPVEDCDENGIVDALQIARGTAPDEDQDGSIDACLVKGDLDGNGIVDGGDLTILLGWWGSAWVQGDFNEDGTIDGEDLLYLLARWSS